MSFRSRAEEQSRKHIQELVDAGTRIVVCPGSAQRIRLADVLEEEDEWKEADEDEDRVLTVEELEARRYKQQATNNYRTLYCPSLDQWFILEGELVKQFASTTDAEQAQARKKKLQARFPVCTGHGPGVPSYVFRIKP